MLFRSIILNNANPFEFLYYIQNAECVITSSFHGTAFSLIFKKELYIFSLHKEGLNERLKSLIKIFSLIENFDSELPFMAYKLSYLDENSRRDQAINYSKQYIINCFNI